MCPELSGDWRITYLPGKTYASYGGTYLGIPKQTSSQKAQVCFEIIKYLTTNPEAQLLAMKTTDAFPALTTVYKNPAMDKPYSYYGGQKVRKLFAEVALNIPAQKVSKYDAIASDIFNNKISKVIKGEISPEAGHKEAVAEMLKFMK
jgi:multiple sugar transport system substrate-binding protein